MIERKLILRVIVLLLLGAIINVAVAWGSALLVDANRLSGQPGVDCWGNQRGWSFESWSSKTTTLVISMDALWSDGPCDPPPYWSIANSPVPDRGENGRFFPAFGEIARGWPLRTLMSVDAIWSDEGETQEFEELWYGIRLQAHDATQAEITVPLRPIWPGFAINTIFYATVLWVIFAIPGIVKRLRRRRTGKCIHCGYDLRGQPVESTKCPECGKSA
jgi:hypothetical protein